MKYHPIAAIRHWLWRRELRNTSVSIISDNCWGGFMSRYCHLPYRSPFVGCFVPAPDYLRMLHSLKAYMEGEMRFIPRAESRYIDRLTHIRRDHPVGILPPVRGRGNCEGIEIHFLHYGTPEEALEKWQRRVARIDYDNLLVKLADRDLCTPELIAEFDRLDYPSKVCFTTKSYPCASVVRIKSQAYRSQVYNEWKYCAAYYNFAREANRLLEKNGTQAGTDAKTE